MLFLSDERPSAPCGSRAVDPVNRTVDAMDRLPTVRRITYKRGVAWPPLRGPSRVLSFRDSTREELRAPPQRNCRRPARDVEHGGRRLCRHDSRPASLRSLRMIGFGRNGSSVYRQNGYQLRRNGRRDPRAERHLEPRIALAGAPSRCPSEPSWLHARTHHHARGYPVEIPRVAEGTGRRRDPADDVLR